MMMTIRRLWVCLAFLIALAVSAPADAQEAPGNWQGIYGGTFLGYAWTDLEFVHSSTSGNDTFSGFAGGVFIGFNSLLTQDILAGLEADLGWADLSDGMTLERFRWALVARLGTLIDPNTLIYGLLGLTSGRYKAQLTTSSSTTVFVFDDSSESIIPMTTTTSQSAAVTKNLWGVVLGGGIEAWTTIFPFLARAGLEYRYTNFDDAAFTLIGQSFDVGANIHEIRLKLIVPFN